MDLAVGSIIIKKPLSFIITNTTSTSNENLGLKYLVGQLNANGTKDLGSLV